jgi:hypothetical protein
MPTYPKSDTRHDGADTTPITVERSDAIDAAGALVALARDLRRQAKSRRNAGAHLADHRAHLRRTADVYDAAAYRMQDAADYVVAS